MKLINNLNASESTIQINDLILILLTITTQQFKIHDISMVQNKIEHIQKLK